MQTQSSLFSSVILVWPRFKPQQECRLVKLVRSGVATSTKAPSTRMRIFVKTEGFFSVLTLRLHVNGIFGMRKRRFSKTLSRVEVFENAVFVFTCGRVKTTELYYISGDRALAKKVWQKTWRISFPKELLRSLDSCCQPLTMAQVLVGTEFTPP